MNKPAYDARVHTWAIGRDSSNKDDIHAVHLYTFSSIATMLCTTMHFHSHLGYALGKMQPRSNTNPTYPKSTA